MNILRTWYDEEIYNKEIEVFFKDCDSNKKMKMPAIMGYASDIAGNDYAEKGLSHYELMEANQVFLLARYHYRFLRMPRVGETITFKTWEKGVDGGYVLRDYEVLDSDDEVCILISSTWIIVNPETRRIIKPRNFSLRKIGSSERILDCEACGKINFSADKLINLGEKLVLYTDIDANGHLNNANYGNIAIDYLPANIRDKTVSDFYINYNKEAKLDEVINIYGYEENKQYYIIGKVENNLCFVCKFVFK